MPIVKQLSIFLENTPGTLSRVISEFAQQKVNLLGLTVSDTKDHAVVRMVVNRPARAIEILEDRGILTLEGDILEVALPNKAGALSYTAARLAKEGINIDYAYGTAPEGGKRASIFMRVDALKKAQSVLKA